MQNRTTKLCCISFCNTIAVNSLRTNLGASESDEQPSIRNRTRDEGASIQCLLRWSRVTITIPHVVQHATCQARARAPRSRRTPTARQRIGSMKYHKVMLDIRVTRRSILLPVATVTVIVLARMVSVVHMRAL